jgi:hypothetical protein
MATAKQRVKMMREIRKEALAEDAQKKREPPMPPEYEPHAFRRAPGVAICLVCGLGEDNNCHGVSGPVVYERLAKRGG